MRRIAGTLYDGMKMSGNAAVVNFKKGEGRGNAASTRRIATAGGKRSLQDDRTEQREGSR